jgi:hypothetical protein
LRLKSGRRDEHMFSVELKSKQHVKSILLANDGRNNVLIEGFLGRLTGVSFTEGLMLAVEGANGILRMDLSEKEVRKLLSKKKALLKKEDSRT